MNEQLDAAIKEFLDIEDPMEKYELLFEYADELDELETSLWSDETRVSGCQSEVHILLRFSENTGAHLRGAADAMIMQGLISLIAIALEGLLPEEVANFEPTFLETIGIQNSLTPSRSNGLRSLIRTIQEIGKMAI